VKTKLNLSFNPKNLFQTMLESLLGGRQILSTPSKERVTMPATIGNEENQENRILGNERRLSTKRASPEPSTPSKMTSFETRPDKRSRPTVMDHPENGSDCGTEVSCTSVSARKQWLRDFGKQHENPFRKSNTVLAPASTFKTSATSSSMMTPTKPAREATATATASAASTLVNRMMTTEPAKKNSTPIRMKPKVHSATIQASNDGYCSVAKLSKWLANDPTSTKKKKHVRRGRNVITKSRQFEKDMENVIIIENNITKGAVTGKKKWLQDVFHGEEEAEDDLDNLGRRSLVTRTAKSEAGAWDVASSISVTDKKDWLKKAFKSAHEEESSNANDESARSGIITDDAASSLSVSDKKALFKKAFNGYSKTQSDVMHSRSSNRDDVAARAKQRFRSRRNAVASPPRKPFRAMPSQGTPQTSRGANKDTFSPTMQPATPEGKNDVPVRSHEPEERTGPPPGSTVEPRQRPGSIVKPVQNASLVVELAPNVEEDKTPVDFRAARQAVLQRGKTNGHQMQVINKVYLKKSKFEKIVKEHKRRSGPCGLLKSSWDQTDPTTTGRPSNAYDKKYVQDIAPKKSFEELP
jgi:hypothetical protein